MPVPNRRRSKPFAPTATVTVLTGCVSEGNGGTNIATATNKRRIPAIIRAVRPESSRGMQGSQETADSPRYEMFCKPARRKPLQADQIVLFGNQAYRITSVLENITQGIDTIVQCYLTYAGIAPARVAQEFSHLLINPQGTIRLQVGDKLLAFRGV